MVDKAEVVSTQSILEHVDSPNDLKKLTIDELKFLAEEVREKIISSVSKTGGHLGAGLGVVELSIAIHHVFDTPNDKLIWDVGHQCYPHKILTGRKKEIEKVRQEDGISGFTKRSESKYDPFGAGHSSTSISAGLGMAVARDLQCKDNHVICVIGDGSMSAGMAFEAMNNAGSQNSRLVVILNDNDMSIAPPVGALSSYLTRLISSRPYMTLRQMAMGVASKFPKAVERTAKKAEEYARTLVAGSGGLFEELGFYYVGPVDGHNLDDLTTILGNIKDFEDARPILLHVVTQKGKGYKPAEEQPSKYHGVGRFDVESGEIVTDSDANITYTSTFSQCLIDEAKKDDAIVAITAAMPSGTGLDKFAKEFPTRMFDVGIAEQHAITFAAGLAADGVKPFVAMYSSFLQRAYDQLLHDVVLQNLPVRFAIDRGGFVGNDGATHHGVFDIALTANLPNLVAMAPSSQQELADMVATAASYNDGPSMLRYPKGSGLTDNLIQGRIIEIGKGKIISEGSKIAVLNLGARLPAVLTSANELLEHGVKLTVVDARFIAPIDTALIDELAKNHEYLVVIEEGVKCGFGASVMQYLSDNAYLDSGKLKVRCFNIEDPFIEQASMDRQYEMARLDAKNITSRILTLLNRKKLSAVS